MPVVETSWRARGIAAVAAVAVMCLGLVAGPAYPQPTPGVWTPAASLAVPRYAHTATRLDGPACVALPVPAWCGGVLVLGGSTTTTTPPVPTDTAAIFTPVTGEWTTAAPMAEPRTGHTATLLGGPPCEVESPPDWCGKVLVAGGANINPAQTNTQRSLASAAVYDPATDSWAATGDLGTPRTEHTATQLLDGRVVVAGGYDHATNTTDPVAEVWDPATGVWSDTGALTNPRRSHHTSTLLNGSPCDVASPPDWCGRVLLAKGRSPTGTNSPNSERYNPLDGTWENGGVSFARSGHAATLLGDARVLFTGGADGSEPRQSVEIYDPVAVNPWRGIGIMAEKRSEHTATLLANGTVLVAGGNEGTNVGPVPGRNAELFDAVTETWSRAGSLATGRYRHSATLLTGPGCATLCGRVLVTGGRTPTEALASSELFDPTVDPPPGRVTDLAAEAQTHTKIRLTWSAVGTNGDDPPVAGDYIVKQSRQPITEDTFDAARTLCDNGVCNYTPLRIGAELTLKVQELRPSTTYYYAVKAVDDNDVSGPMSDVAEATTQADTIDPGRVGDLRAKARRRHRVKLIWSATGSDRNKPPPVRKYLVKQSRRAITSNARFRKAVKLCKCRFRPAEVGDRLTLKISYTRRSKGTVFHYALKAIDDSGNVGRLSNSTKVRVR